MDDYKFDRYLRYKELTAWVHAVAERYPGLVELTSIGKSHQNRDQWLLTITNSATGHSSEKPAHWTDANIHSTETTAGVAACYLIHYLVTSFTQGKTSVVDALNSRTFYVLPRVNPDGVEAALADSPCLLRSSVRPWPWRGHVWPGFQEKDITGDGKILTMRIEDPHGAWVAHPEEPRVMIPVDDAASPVGNDKFGQNSLKRYRLLPEGLIENYDGFTIPTPKRPTALDLNRNFPAGWGKEVNGSGDHALSEPEIYNLVRAITQRPNICGYNAYHTSGGVLLRPSSTQADDAMSYVDVWVWKEMGKRATELTGCTVHSCYEDYTLDQKNETMSGASDDFVYEHLGIYGWTTEFWDVVYAATGHRGNTKRWYLGHTTAEYVAIARWADIHAPQHYHAWRRFEHPQLGWVEIGGVDDFNLITNPPEHMLKEEVAPHAEFALYQAMLSPKLEVLMFTAEKVAPVMGGEAGSFIWRVKVGIANTGFLPTHVTSMALKINAVLPVTVELRAAATSGAAASAVKMADGCSPNRIMCGQLTGRIATRINWRGVDGTPERHLSQWLIICKEGDAIEAIAEHPRAGTSRRILELK